MLDSQRITEPTRKRMRLGAAFLRSKVARRVFTLFVVSALLPIGALALLSFVQVSEQLEEHSRRELHRESKHVGMSLLDRLEFLEDELKSAASRLPTHAAQVQIEPVGGSLGKTRFRALGFRDHEGRLRSIWGAMRDAPTPSPAERRHLELENSWITTHQAENGTARIFLTRLLDSKYPQQRMLIAELDPGKLFEFELGSNMKLSVFDPLGRVLFSSSHLPEPSIPKAGAQLLHSQSGWFDWEHRGEAFRASYWDVFLKPRFYTSHWTIVLSTPAANALAPMRQFKRIFPPVILLSVLTVILLSISQIRKYLVPLEKLRDATRRIANQEFHSQVTITSGDEFQDLAESFNSMAERLAKQFRILATLAEIDRIILGSMDANYIIETLLTRIHEIVACDLVWVLQFDRDEMTSGQLHIKHKLSAEPIRILPITLQPQDLAELPQDPPILLTLGNTAVPHPGYLSPLEGFGVTHCLVFPILVKEHLAAIIGLGYRQAPALTPEDLRPLPGLADRAAVALSNAAWEERLYYQAHYDSLTGLPNRVLFKDRLEQALTRAQRERLRVAVLFIDLDRFKNVNDSLGHSAGDQLLVHMAEALATRVRSSDTVSRLGGDEFTVLIPDIGEHEDVISVVALVADKILAVTSKPLVLDQRELSVTTSIGIAMYPRDAHDGESLIRNADAAMYHAKASGRGHYQFYSEELNAAALERLTLEASLRCALERDELRLYYQPTVSSRDGRIVGAEVLLRWQHTDLGLIQPLKFIPLAEETGLIVPIGEWVLRSACAQCKAWQEQGLPTIRVAVNLSARQFRQPGLLTQVGQALKETGLAPACLELEITESMTMEDLGKALSMLKQLRDMGVGLSLDDFGTGYSSLSHLRQFPISSLKIDQSFVRNIPGASENLWIIKTIVTLAHGMDLNVIAEGIETQEQYDLLRDHGCEEMQGYFISRPLPASEFSSLLGEEMVRVHAGRCPT